MNLINISILKKVSVLVILMGIASGIVAIAGAIGLVSLGDAMKDVGAREEVAREAMDLRIDIVAISRMTYQLALEPEKAAEFVEETERRATEMLARLPKIESTADANEKKELENIRSTLDAYFAQIREMVRVAGTPAAERPGVMANQLAKALESQKTVTTAVKAYSKYSAESLAHSRSEAIATSQNTMLLLISIAAGAIVFGVFLSVTLARRGIVDPIRTLTVNMAKIADGELHEKAPGTERGDEIGEMARTLEIFRANRLHMQKMEMQEAALQNQSRDLQSSISGIVASAVAGDFSQRIDRHYEDPDLAHFASSVNELLTNVDAGVTEVRRVVAALSRSDLTQDMRGNFQGAFAELQTNVNQAMTALRGTMLSIRGVGTTINNNSSELSAAANQLARRTEQQAAALEETAAALEEITTTVRSSSERAKEANTMVGHTRESAGKSGNIVRNAIEAMGRIEQSSEKISTIISVIDEIAFQTNLLALNAGVEAARAGEAGRGFAVVAQEVRELAQRSASAAREIKGLINTSAEEVNAGVSLVRSTGEALEEIVDLVNRVNGHVSGIARAAVEQSTALGEISISVTHMDQMTQQNAGMVEETTAASEILASEARQLQSQLDRFHLERTGAKSVEYRAAA